MKGKPKKDGSGMGTRENKGRGECEFLEIFGKGRNKSSGGLKKWVTKQSQH